MEIQAKKSTKLVALTIVFTVFTGVAGWAGAFFAFFNLDSSGVGMSLLASALAFGLLANAVLRD